MSGEQKPHFLDRFRNASTRLRSVSVINPFQALEAYISLATTTDLNISCSAAWHMPLFRSTRSAYSVWEQLLITPRSWSEAERTWVNVTPSTFKLDSRTIPDRGARGVAFCRAFGFWNTISFVLDVLRVHLVPILWRCLFLLTLYPVSMQVW